MRSSPLDPGLISLAQRVAGSPEPSGRIHPASRSIRKLRRRLKNTYDRIHASLENARLASRAEEWLLDNRHVVEDALETLDDNLPDSYMRQLTRVSSPDGAGPMVHPEALARELLEAGQLPVDLDWVRLQVDCYQELAVLKIGDLWALPSLLALSVIERLLNAADMIDQPACREPEDREQQAESELAAGKIAGLIISLRNIEAHDWHGFFESVSRVDRILAEDPAGAFGNMDFASRNRYRSRIEALAHGARLSEAEVARAAIKLADEAEPVDSRTRHVGYYLISGGRRCLEVAIDFHPSPRELLFRFADRWPNLLYFSLLALLFLIPMGTLWFGLSLTSVSAPALPLVLILLAVPTAGLSLTLLNGLLIWLLPPRVLARLDFDTGIPATFRTAVVMPVLLVDADDVEQVFEKLEINFLANRDPHLVYAILGDFADADQRNLSQDGEILSRARICLERLQRRYGDDRFLFLCRERQWNPAEDRWMGWERKRGKLTEFNRLLAGSTGTSYDCILGERSALDELRYVITLDADTRMPPGVAAQLVGTMAHPLSQAWFEPSQPGLKGGYSIIQPRLEIDPDSTRTSFFTRIFSGDNTLDLYTHASSDAYHDLFGDGVFTGKGIYDWRAMEHCLENRIPENSVLSHDLLEGIHGRVGLVTDLILLEQFPPTSLSWMRRLHRWVRGDWQLLPWLSPWPRRANGHRERNNLAPIHLWKIFDNLRRSLLPPATLILLLMTFLGLLPGDPVVWTLVISALLAAPLWSDLLSLLTRVVNRPTSAPGVLLSAPAGLLRQLGHWLVSLALLPWQSQILLDAISRSFYRMYFSRRQLLEWTTAAHVHRRQGKNLALGRFVRELWFSVALSITTFIAILLIHPPGLVVGLPFLLAWFFAPLLVRRIDKPQQGRRFNLDHQQQRFLRTTARRTWLFFRRFVEPDNHWLPPDNYQEEPSVALARRTSPTNMGMSLNAALAAHDFGWLDVQTLIAWLDNSMERMGELEHYRGHWLNWYETENLRPLNPRYVSTVDSGNLAAALITLARGLDDVAAQSLAPGRLLNGIADTLAVVRETLTELPGDGRRDALLEPILKVIHQLVATLTEADVVMADSLLEELHSNGLETMTEQILALSDKDGIDISPEALHQLRIWLEELDYEIDNAREHIRTLMPWLINVERIPGLDQLRQIDSWRSLENHLIDHWTLAEAARADNRLDTLISKVRNDPQLTDSGVEDFLDQLPDQIQGTGLLANRCLEELMALRCRADRWVDDMEFGFLYDSDRHLFSIGFDVSSGTLDHNHYDLLASEARLASLVAIGKGDVPLRHWLYLGRPFRRRRGRGVLMSWGATLFEYLMPGLYTQTPPRSLVDRAGRAAIRMHRDFSERRGLPWGISESGYYQLDQRGHYQYRSFGVPKLGFRRDLGDRMVIAPYASLLALPSAPKAVIENLEKLRQDNALGLYGFHEAVDYGRREKLTPRRGRVVRSWMSHHQGMILLAIDNFLNDASMIRRFHADRRMAGASLVLHERMPRSLPRLKASRQPRTGAPVKVAPGPEQWLVDPTRQHPQYCLLSNGHYSLTVDSDGNGGAFWNGIMLTRWSADRSQGATADQFLIKDLDSGEILNTRPGKSDDEPNQATTSFGPHRVDIQRSRSGLTAHVRLAIASQHDVEARKLILTNEEDRPRRIMVISQADVAMAPRSEYERHPAFSRLFVESECLPDERTLLFRRRPRSGDEKPLYLAHAMVLAADCQARFGWDTQRSSFQGRSRTVTQAAARLNGVAEMAGRVGAVVDPAMVAGVELTIPAYGRVELATLSGAGRSRRRLLAALRAYQSLSRVDWLFEQAYMQTAQELHVLRIQPQEVPEFMRLYTAMVAPEPGWRRLDGELPPLPLQLALFSRGISGDWPICLALVGEHHQPVRIERLLAGHAFLSGRQWASDLVFIDESAGGYGQPSRDYICNQIEEVRGRLFRVLNGSVHVISGRELGLEQRQGLMHASSLVLSMAGDSIDQQIDRRLPAPLPPLVPSRSPDWKPMDLDAEPELEFDNGYGGYDVARREYLIRMDSERPTPAPWCNVLANPHFGVLVGSGGSQCTWADNSSENRITPWLNEPAVEPSGEVVYLRDEETGEVWSPMPGPAAADGPSRLRHGLGYSVFEHAGKALNQTVEIHVDPRHPIKICRLTLTNCASWTRRITATYYLEWVLGTNRDDHAAHLRCGSRPELNALFASNPFSPRFGRQQAFLAANIKLHGCTSCRSEFLGYCGSPANPAALGRLGLSGQCAPGVDPCGAIQVHLDIPPGQERSVCFLIGQGEDRDRACRLLETMLQPGAIEDSRRLAEQSIVKLLDRVQVKTPEPAFDRMINHWLPWQTLMGRLWGRTGYYQSSGAFGFRDQLQDQLAMLWLDPGMVRGHLLKAASRQFVDGDVLHWWHEAPLRGVRTRCSDDLLWLPYAVSQYVQSTGDASILAESVSYLAGDPLAAEESERYSEFAQSERRESLYEHCKRAIDRACTVGPHGLPTIGNGDWNDGFNRISVTGRGESVWLAWFLIRVLKDFSTCCDIQGEGSCADLYRRLAGQFLERAESVAWDGAWYQRAYFDDGRPLGSARNEECRIDLIAQAWSVLAQEEPTDRSRQAMASALSHLVDEDHRLIKLLAPPFDKGRDEPGYIKGYPPGIRENGAQYTHAATWAVWATARLGDGDRAMQLFRFLNPLLRATSPAACEHYRLEPYVLAGDIYSVGQNRGRGGWSWYTGAAAWLYRSGLEALLGLQQHGDSMKIDPCLPQHWPGFSVSLRRGASTYLIEVTREDSAQAETFSGTVKIRLNGARQISNQFAFIDDNQDHLVEVRLYD